MYPIVFIVISDSLCLSTKMIYIEMPFIILLYPELNEYEESTYVSALQCLILLIINNF